MRKTGKYVGIVAAVAAIITAASFWSSHTRGTGAEVSDERGRQLLAAISPHLKTLYGGELPLVPIIRTVDAESLNNVPHWDAKTFVSWRFPGLDPTIHQRCDGILQQQCSKATIARRIEGTKTIIVVPENLPVLAGWHEELTKCNCEAFVQLAIVHEYACMVLENQMGLFDKKFDPRSLEECRIQQALRDGWAQWITLQYAKSIGAEELFPLLARRWLHVPDGSTDARLRAIYQTTLQHQHWASAHGLQLYEYLRQAGIDNLPATVYEHPPTQAEWFEKPERYVHFLRSRSANLKTVVHSIAADVLPGWQASQQPWTPLVLKQIASVTGMEARSELAVNGWQQGEYILWTQPRAPGRNIALSVVQFEQDKQARAFFGFAAEMQRELEKQSAAGISSLPYRVRQSKLVPFRCDDVDEAVKYERALDVVGVEQSVPSCTLIARSGRLVVELDWFAAYSDTAWAETVLQRVIRALGD